jgi:hypothetical protein
MISAILMLRRLAGALSVALREEDFARILAAGLALIIIGTLAYSVGGGWSLVDGLYVAVATLTTSSVLDPKLTVTDPWLKVDEEPSSPAAVTVPRNGACGRSGRRPFLLEDGVADRVQPSAGSVQ